MSTELPPLPASLTEALDAYADRVSEYDVAVKIYVGVSKAGQIATDALGKALEEILAYARAAVAAEREACADCRAQMAQVEQWQQEGERLLSQQSRSVLFALGAWWADRPWRDRATMETHASST